MHIANDPEPTPTPDYLWRVLREYIGALMSTFGDPLDIARRVWIRRDEARAFAELLRPLEMMLRRLIFLQALEFEMVAAPASPMRKHKPRPRHDTYNLETSTSWYAPFDLALERRRPRRLSSETDGNMPAGAPALRPRLPNAEFTRPLALRAEALINDPAPLVARMARLLARDRARQHKPLADVRACDRAKPFFAQAAQTIALAREHFQRWLEEQLNKRLTDSS